MNTKSSSRVLLTILIAAALLSGDLSLAGPPDSGSGTSTSQNQGEQAGDPIATNSGVFHFSMPLLALGGPFPLRFVLSYRMDYISGEGMLSRFQSDLFPYLERMQHPTTDQFVAEISLANGETPQFTYNSDTGQWELDDAAAVRYVLKETGADVCHGYYYLLSPMQNLVYIFEKIPSECYAGYAPARVAYVLDRNGNRHTYTYTGSQRTPDRVEDGLGRRFDLAYYPGSSTLRRVTDQAGRSVQLNRELNAPDCNNLEVLRSVTDAQGETTTFHYSPVGCSVAAIDLPEGNTPYTRTVARKTLNGIDWNRVTAQTDAYGNTTHFAYDTAADRVTETRPDGAAVIYEHFHENGVPKSITDATGKAVRFSQSPNEQVTQVTDRLGDSTNTAYHPATGKIASFQNAEGQTTTNSYTAQSQTFTNPANDETVDFTFYNLTSVASAANSEIVDLTFHNRVSAPDAETTHSDYTYDAHGNVLTFVDQRGKTWAYTYSSKGLPLTLTNPTGGTATFTYNADGTLASSTDSDAASGTTTYAYDGYKRLGTITYSGGATVQFTYDLNDRLLTTTDERGKTTTYTYDGNGNLDTARNPLGQTYTNAQDLMDRLASITDPLAHRSVYTYDSMNRLASVTDRNGSVTTYTYNSRGWRTGITDAAGKAWTTAYDDEGVPTSTTTPLGFVTSFQTDRLGRVTRMTDPLGHDLLLDYDALGRLTTLTDRLGRTTTLTYDATGQLASVTKPVIGTAAYARNDAGLVNRITDPRGKKWDFGYSTIGRLTSHTDPLGRQATYAYDARGWLRQVAYPDGSGTATYTYDGAGNITQAAYAGGPTLNYAYDDAGRVLTANDIALTYDARGDVTTSQDGGASFGATYDNGQRLATVTYDGQGTVTYAYDARDLLTRVADSRAGAWIDFSYDDDRRLLDITRSNGAITTFTYDDAGRVTRIQDGSLADQQYTLNAEGDLTQVVRTLPLDPAPAAWRQNLAFDDAAQISSAGYAYDARGRQTAAPGKTFAYDEANRLTQVTAGGSAVSLTYNGLDDLRTRTTGSTTTTYYHNYALGLDPIAAEKEGSAYKRFYVYTPDGSLLYSIDAATNQVRFYHFDRLGSTLFLTDGAGAVSDAYAYDPYGNLLGRTGSSDQPFTYIGQYGVRSETVGNLYDMRARTYDPLTARFLTRDPVWPDLIDPQALNPYQYAFQNPLRHVDPEGTAVHWGDLTQDQLIRLALWGTTEEREAALKEMRRRQRIWQQTGQVTPPASGGPAFPTTAVAVGGTVIYAAGEVGVVVFSYGTTACVASAVAMPAGFAAVGVASWVSAGTTVYVYVTEGSGAAAAASPIIYSIVSSIWDLF